MEVRLAAARDIEELYQLNELFENKTSKENMQQLIIEDNHEIISIAYDSGIAVGYSTGLIIKSICYSDYRVDIEALYVREAYRK